MSYPHHHFYALNHQRGHQLFYDQVLETYPISGSASQYLPGGYGADGSVLSFGKDCTVRQSDQYNMPTCCSTWASGASAMVNGSISCCPYGAIPRAQAQEAIPAPFFPVSLETEVSVATKHQ